MKASSSRLANTVAARKPQAKAARSIRPAPVPAKQVKGQTRPSLNLRPVELSKPNLKTGIDAGDETKESVTKPSISRSEHQEKIEDQHPRKPKNVHSDVSPAPHPEEPLTMAQVSRVVPLSSERWSCSALLGDHRKPGTRDTEANRSRPSPLGQR